MYNSILVFGLTPCSGVIGYQHFREPWSMVGILPHHYMASQSGRLQLESSSIWRPQVRN